MEDPQPQQTDVIMEPSTLDVESNIIITPVPVDVNVKIVEDVESHHNVRTDHTESAEAHNSSDHDESDSAEVTAPETKSKEEIEQVEHQPSNSEAVETDKYHTVKNPVEGEESHSKVETTEESAPTEFQQTDQSQNVETESNNQDHEQNPPEVRGLTIKPKIITVSDPNKIKEVAEEEETEEVKEVKESDSESPTSSSSLRKERNPKLNNLRVKTHAKHMVDMYEDVKSTAIPNIEVSEIQEDDNEAQTEKKEESSNAFGSPSLRKVQSSSQIAYLTEPEGITEKILKPAPLKRVSSHSTGLTKQQEEPVQPNSAATPSKSRVSMEDFQKITSVGRGSYGEVFLVKKISNNKLYALKSIDKNFMKKERKEHQVYVEREVLLKLNHPNIIKLYSSFQDKNKLYFVLEYISGGEFSDYLRVQGKLSKDQIVFFTAEIINILEYIHTAEIAHRDLKPENILLTQDGHLKCIDFGTARYLAIEKRTAELYDIKNKAEDTLEGGPPQVKKNHRTTFVGTAQYVSPEMLDGADTGAAADLWALGCIIYLMATGQFAFVDMNEYLIFQKIKAVTVKYPDDMDPEIKDLIQKLLVKSPDQRLGAGPQGFGNDYETLKSHSLFKGIEFSTLHEQKAPVVEIASPHKRKSYDLDPVTPINAGAGNRKHFHSDDLSRTESRGEKSIDYTTDKGIRVIISGLVLKKCGWWFFRPRQLILNSKPKLVYYDPDSNQLKGEIFLAPTTKAELDSKTKFTIITPTRKYIFKEMEHSAEKWVEIINTTVAQLYSKKVGL